MMNPMDPMNPMDLVDPAGARFRQRPALSPSEVRSVVFTTTRMRLGYDVEEVDSFLDQVEWSMEQMLHEIALLRQQLMVADRNNEARIAEVRRSLEHLLGRLGGMPLAAAPTNSPYAAAAGASQVGAMGPGPAHQRPLEHLGQRAAGTWGAGYADTQVPDVQQGRMGAQQAAAYAAAPGGFAGPAGPAAQTPTYTVTDAAAPPLRPPTGAPAGGPPPQQRPAPFAPPPQQRPAPFAPPPQQRPAPFAPPPQQRPAPFAPPAGAPVGSQQVGPAFGGAPTGAPFQSARPSGPMPGTNVPPGGPAASASVPPANATAGGYVPPAGPPANATAGGYVPPAGPLVDLPPPSAA